MTSLFAIPFPRSDRGYLNSSTTQAERVLSTVSKPLHSVKQILLLIASAAYLFSLHFDPEDGGNIFLWNVSWLSLDYAAWYPRRYNFSQPRLWEPQT
jgi:hypothetical protein